MKIMVFKLKSQNVNTQSKLQSILSDIIRPLIDQLKTSNYYALSQYHSAVCWTFASVVEL